MGHSENDNPVEVVPNKNVELRGPDSPFPVAVEPKPPKLSAYDFASYTGQRSSDGVGIEFGMDQIQCAKVLRGLADKIEQRQYILQSGRVMSNVRRDDFPMTVLRLVFYEGPPREPENVNAPQVKEGVEP